MKNITEDNLSGAGGGSYDLLCLSHLRWDFVYQRPQHLLSRFARVRRVFFYEEPIFGDGETHLEISSREDNLFVLVPHVSHSDRENGNVADIQRQMLDELLDSQNIENFALWFYTPMAMDYAAHLQPLVTIFDCMDELSAFKFAPPELIENERRLLEKADLVFHGRAESLRGEKRQARARFSRFRRALTPRTLIRREISKKNLPIKNHRPSASRLLRR
jgi:UDP-galactopyranose mutase